MPCYTEDASRYIQKTNTRPRPPFLQAVFLCRTVSKAPAKKCGCLVLGGYTLKPYLYTGRFRFERENPNPSAVVFPFPQPLQKEEILAHSCPDPLYGHTVLSSGSGSRRNPYANDMGQGQNHYAGCVQQGSRHFHHCWDRCRFHCPVTHELQQKRPDGGRKPRLAQAYYRQLGPSERSWIHHELYYALLRRRQMDPVILKKAGD